MGGTVITLSTTPLGHGGRTEEWDSVGNRWRSPYPVPVEDPPRDWNPRSLGLPEHRSRPCLQKWRDLESKHFTRISEG